MTPTPTPGSPGSGGPHAGLVCVSQSCPGVSSYERVTLDSARQLSPTPHLILDSPFGVFSPGTDPCPHSWSALSKPHSHGLQRGQLIFAELVFRKLLWQRADFGLLGDC